MRFLAVFGLVALAEMATFFWVESRIGLLWALAIAASTAIIGSILVRRAGISVLGRMRRRWSEGKVPGRELSDGAAVLVAGAFLISPGFLTDALGFLLLLPAFQSLVYRTISSRVSSRVSVFTSGPRPFGQEWPGTQERSLPDDDIIDIEEVD